MIYCLMSSLGFLLYQLDLLGQSWALGSVPKDWAGSNLLTEVHSVAAPFCIVLPLGACKGPTYPIIRLQKLKTFLHAPNNFRVK